MELAGLKERKNVTCIQIWHANGALKKFGWEDKAAQKRSARDKKTISRSVQMFFKSARRIG
nr:CDP-glycerol glycerophosphotransferase family protein [Listeria monocytogenes]